MAIRVFLLDDHEIVRRGIAQLLETQDDIEVVGEAGTAAQALARIPALRPDVAILDVRLPDGEGVSVCRDVRSAVSPPPAWLVLERLRRGEEPEDPRFASLSPQERRILELIADGLTNKQIGAELFLAEKTVKNYVSSLLHKLGFGRRTEAAVYASERRRSSH